MNLGLSLAAAYHFNCVSHFTLRGPTACLDLFANILLFVWGLPCTRHYPKTLSRLFHPLQEEHITVMSSDEESEV